MLVETTSLVGSVDHVFATVFAQPVVETFVRSGPHVLRLVFTRKSLADEFLPSFLRDETRRLADLQIGFVTSADVDLSHLIPDPPSQYHSMARNECFALWQSGDRPMLYLLDRASQRALIWLAAELAPDWIASRPALPLMAAFSINTDWIALHAAAIGKNGKCLLLAGDGRAGKTTAAVSCAFAGWDYAGDDYVLINTADAKIEPLYCSARLRADIAPAFPGLLNAPVQISSSDGEPRYELRFGGERGYDRIKGGSLAALLLPRRRGAKHPEFAPARRIDAIAGLKTSMSLAMTHFHRDTREAMIRKLVTVIGLAPIFFVDTGQCPAKIPVAFAEFLDRL